MTLILRRRWHYSGLVVMIAAAAEVVVMIVIRIVTMGIGHAVTAAAVVAAVVDCCGDVVAVERKNTYALSLQNNIYTGPSCYSGQSGSKYVEARGMCTSTEI